MATEPLGNLPANVATPTYLAARATEIADRHGMTATILGPAEMAEQAEVDARYLVVHPGRVPVLVPAPEDEAREWVVAALSHIARASSMAER